MLALPWRSGGTLDHFKSMLHVATAAIRCRAALLFFPCSGAAISRHVGHYDFATVHAAVSLTPTSSVQRSPPTFIILRHWSSLSPSQLTRRPPPIGLRRHAASHCPRFHVGFTPVISRCICAWPSYTAAAPLHSSESVRRCEQAESPLTGCLQAFFRAVGCFEGSQPPCQHTWQCVTPSSLLFHRTPPTLVIPT